jgi:uncharacterized membrane protein YhdT
MYTTLSYAPKRAAVLQALPTWQKPVNYSLRVLILILAFVVIRLILSTSIDLGNDEAYYWLYSQHLQWNYFDHPPVVAFWVRLFTLNLNLQDHVIFVRLGSVVSAAFSTWFIYKTTSTLHSEKAGWYSALLYNTCYYASIVAGVFIMPDSPQMFFWTFSLWMLARIVKEEDNWTNWILFGLAAGLCIMSKVHGIFIWFGLGLYTVFLKRSWLRKPQFYLSILLTSIVVSPLVVWNVQYDFVTWRFHSQRINIIDYALHLKNFVNEIGGQLFFNNPVNMAILIIALVSSGKKLLKKVPALSLYILIGGPLAFVLLLVSMFRPTLPHWNGPAYVSLIPISAIYLARRERKFIPNSLKLSLIVFLTFIVIWPLFTSLYPGTWGSKNLPEYGKGDISLDMYGWRSAGKRFSSVYDNAVKEKVILPNSPVVCSTWWGAHVEYYFCRPADLTMIGLGNMQEIHHYLWTNEFRRQRVDFKTAVTILPSDENYDIRNHFSKYYSRIDLIDVIKVQRSKKDAHMFYVYRLSGWKNALPVWPENVKPPHQQEGPLAFIH